MKKTFVFVLFITIAIVLCGCTNKSEPSEEAIPLGDYVMKESEEIAKPTVQIQDDKKIYNYL